MQNIVIVIPAFEPDAILVQLIEELQPAFRAIVVVDDGSRLSEVVFSSLPRADNILLFTHSTNRGKGNALKTAFAETLRRYPDAIGVITVDADGQHLAKDILSLSQTLCSSPSSFVLGVRTFGSGTPFRSRLGNLWTCAEFFALTRTWIGDTQTGLRAIPLQMLNRLLKIPGERYEYEIRSLVEIVASRQNLIQVPITTVYREGNRSSHFRPLADTIKTQAALFSAVFTSRITSHEGR